MGPARVRALRRFRLIAMRAILLFLAFCLAQPAEAGTCAAQSGSDILPLVELYTAKNCAGCAPAEAWLSSLKDLGPEGVLPVIVPMDDRDTRGEPKARPSRKLTVLQRVALVYRPYVMLQGRELAGWNTGRFEAALAKLHASAPSVRFRLQIVSLSGETIDVVVEADAPALLYLAAYGVGLESVPLVVEWQGPFAVYSGTEVRRTLAIPSGTAPNNSGVLAFVQDRRTGEVLQALRLPAC